MPQIGDSAKPALSYAEGWSSSSAPNQSAQLFTMPERGRINRLGIWAAGWSESVSTRLVVWNAAGAVIGQTAAFTMSGRAYGTGNVDNYEADLLTPVDIDAAATFYAGLSRDPSKSHQLTARSTAGAARHYDNRRTSWPSTIIPNDGGDHGYGDYTVGFYVADYVAIRGGWIYRSGAWVRADTVYAYRSGAWAEVDTVSVYRSGAWSEAD